jgi:hypothetical protein
VAGTSISSSRCWHQRSTCLASHICRAAGLGRLWILRSFGDVT